MWFVGWVEMDLWAPHREQVGMRKHDRVWGAVKEGQAVHRTCDCVGHGWIHDRFLKGPIVQEALKAESCLLGVEWGPELERERNAMCRD